MRHVVLFLLLFLFPLVPSFPQLSAQDESWPQFRGPGGQGHASARGLPSEWGESKNIVWKVPLRGNGWSSPVIKGEKIWLTTSVDEGRSLRVLCLNRNDGKLLHDVEVFRQEQVGSIHSKNSHASPTPILEGDRVYVHFGAFGSACLTSDGRIVWKNRLEYEHRHGPASSPVLFEDLLIYNCDGTDVQFVAALDKHTGELRWKKFRQGRMAYSTPLAIEVEGEPQLVSTGGDQVVTYHPLSGEKIWWSRYDGFSLVPRPVFGLGMVYICTGYPHPVLYAIRPDGRGDVTESHVAWTLKRGVPLNPSPLLVGEELYMVSDRGIASCVDARTGKHHWQERLPGEYSASPVYADGRIYLLNEEGEATVLEVGKEFKKLATNRLPGRTLASFAAHGRAIYLRSDSHLYRIENQAD